MSAYRTKFIDYDTRREPKTERYCIMCQRDLKLGQPFRTVMYEIDRFHAVHTDDWDIARADIESRRTCLGPVQFALMGMDWARKLGMEFSR